MGISLTIYTATDEELLLLQTHPKSFAKEATGRASCYLSSYWRFLNSMLTADAKVAPLPLTALTQGDLRYPDLEDGAHAIWSATTRLFDDAVQAFGETQIREQLERDRDTMERRHRGTVNAGRWLATPSEMNQQTLEYAHYLRGIQTIAAKAASGGHGLLFTFWEDW